MAFLRSWGLWSAWVMGFHQILAQVDNDLLQLWEVLGMKDTGP